MPMMRGSIFRCGSLRLGWHRATRLATSWKRPGESRGYASEKDHDDEDHWPAKYFPNQEEWILKQAEAWWHKGQSFADHGRLVHAWQLVTGVATALELRSKRFS